MNTPSPTNEADTPVVVNSPDRAKPRMRKGDEAGFQIFLENNAAHLHSFARVRLSDDQDAAQDVVRATVSEAVRNLGVLHSAAHAGVPTLIWLFRLCRLEIKEHVHCVARQTHRKFTAQNLIKLKDAILGLANKGDDVGKLCADESLRHLVVVIFDRLPERESAALELKYLHGSSNHEVALLLDLTEPATHGLLSRARVAFREELKRMSDVLKP